MADRDDRGDIVIEHPNRARTGSKVVRLIVVLLLLASAALLVVLSIGGWEELAGAKPLQVFYILLYLTFAFFIARWKRGMLPVASAFAIILSIFALVSAPGWYARDNVGFAQTTLPAASLGLLCIVLAVVQIVLILFAMRGFQQSWNVEVERSRDDLEAGRGGGGRRGAVAAPA